jgi:hypothetical protein
MCGFACALCVWQESQDRAVFGADTPRTIMCKYRVEMYFSQVSHEGFVRVSRVCVNRGQGSGSGPDSARCRSPYVRGGV